MFPNHDCLLSDCDPSADTTQSSNKISQVLMKMQNNQWRDVKTWRGISDEETLKTEEERSGSGKILVIDL